MTRQAKRKKAAIHKFGVHLQFGKFAELATEFQGRRLSPPDVKSAPGKRTGEILRFVRGLRLSARVIYILRGILSGEDVEVSWGHLLDGDRAYCSRECDIIIHDKGYVDKWNGDQHPVMDFRFIDAEKAHVVVSCKSILTNVDTDYPKEMRKFGIKHTFLFAECCAKADFKELHAKAKKAGYAGLGCLYFTSPKAGGFTTDETVHADFGKAVCKCLNTCISK